MQIKTASASHKSSLHKDNEDAVAIVGNTILLADGMGGEAHGYEASHVAIESAKEFIRQISSESTVNVTIGFLKNAIEHANTSVLERVPGGGSTLSLASILINIGQAVLVYANTGDSRIDVLRQDNLMRLTQDQNLLRAAYEDTSGNTAAQYGVKRPDKNQYQEINKKLDIITNTFQLTDEELIYFKKRNIVFGGIGTDSLPKIDYGSVALQLGDRIIVASDGIHDNVTSENIIQVLLQTKELDINRQAERLVEMAESIASQQLSNGRSKPDDITVAIIDIS